MAADDGERTSVRTYVPRYQKERWQSHAADLDMSQSEFVRTMVQAGRKGFDPEPEELASAEETDPPSPDANPGGNGLEDRVVETLSDGAHYDWEELLAALTDDIEQRLDETLQELQSDGRVRYSGRHGGYVLDE
ncbi:DUF5805 domain-containing protein [Haloarcula onubensis]|uniref:DUF5805 domain-containing protein n=1 Tax=Haloarcula onubensis TaxID=2950539 RepID=A0ABU2FM10_9EURY|nr:DUF5805 domain-containing protein [Halomicroarcula sp. S3CR25-11]MDS0281800.1 DUF5805 domain-containing protein [Halomicroarcula sp. S3CR25-11]